MISRWARLHHRRLPLSKQSRQQDTRLYLRSDAIGISYVIPFKTTPTISIGNVPRSPVNCKSAPSELMASQFDPSDAATTTHHPPPSLAHPHPPTTPPTNAHPSPEFPISKGSKGSRNAPPTPLITSTPSGFRSTEAPKATMAANVLCASSPSK